MARRVLLIEPDVDELGALASKLRLQGLVVVIADSIDGGVERCRSGRIDVLLITSMLVYGEAEATFSAAPELKTLPRFVLVDGVAEQRSDEIPRWDSEGIAKRVYALTRSVPAVSAGGDFRGDLGQVSVPDLLQLLGANRRSGTLSLGVPSGSAEVRLVSGEVVDAVYRRVDGEKALVRLLGEREGSFAFIGGSPPTLRRIERPTQSLLLDGMRQLDEVARLREALAVDSDSLLAVMLSRGDLSEAEQGVLEALVTPRVLEELLDEVPLPDLEVLGALSSLLERGAVRRFARGALRVDFADAERLGLLSAMAKRVARPGFEGAPRIGLGASQQRLSSLLPAFARINDVAVATDVPPSPIPYRLATLRLADGASLEVTGLPLVEAFTPLWAFVLPSCAAVARLEPDPTEALQGACQLASVPLLDAESALGEGQDPDPEKLAGLLRNALERAGGAE